MQVYLKFSKSDIPKREVLKQMFVVKNVFNSKIKVLNQVQCCQPQNQ